MKRQGEYAVVAVAAVATIGLAVALYGYSGSYNVGADAPHWSVTHKIVQTVRERAIRSRSANIKVPNLSDPALVLKGAGQYDAMCTNCHLKPGVNNSELHAGIYPQPPNLSHVRVDPRDAFWTIKHGIKMTAMPAWGGSHDDEAIWSMVAFAQKLPGMTTDQYREMVAKAPPDNDTNMELDSDSKLSHSRPASERDSDVATSATASGELKPQAITGEGTTTVTTVLRERAVPAAEEVAQKFVNALRADDPLKALTLLAPEAKISEGDETQSVDEYAAHHMGEDIAFLKHCEVTPVARKSMAVSDTALVVTETNLICESKETVKVRSNEQMKLRKRGNQWLIVSIKWMSYRLTQ